MIQNPLYLGVHEDEWNSLKTEAEDLLYETTDGQHILGLYPFGERILGFENAAPGILCLYLRSPLDLLDPSKTPGPAIRQSIGIGCGPILYIDIFYWVATLGQRVRGSQGDPFVHIIPCRHDVLWQSPGIEKILGAADSYLGLAPPILPGPGSVYLEGKSRAAMQRTRLLMHITDSFNPCINPDWEPPMTLPNSLNYSEDIKELDLALINKQELSSEQYSIYITWTYKKLLEIYNLRQLSSQLEHYKKLAGIECAVFLKTLL